jgi:hypothetical protein
MSTKEECCSDCLCKVIDCFVKHQKPAGCCCFIQASDDREQPITGTNVPQLVRHGTVDGHECLSLLNGTDFVIEKAGTYFMIAAPQVGSAAGGGGNFRVFWKLNGVNVPNSNVLLNLTGGQEDATQDVIVSQGAMKLAAGDVLQVWMAGSNADAGVRLEAIQPSPLEPLVPSIITTIHSVCCD